MIGAWSPASGGISKPAEDGFFGSVMSGLERFGEKAAPVFGTFSEKMGGEILPNWVGSQLNIQSKDQLEKATFDWGTAPRRVDYIQTPEAMPGTRFADLQLFRMGNFNITGGTLLIMGGVFLGMVVILKKL